MTCLTQSPFECIRECRDVLLTDMQQVSVQPNEVDLVFDAYFYSVCTKNQIAVDNSSIL
jgi:hypothetical protein